MSTDNAIVVRGPSLVMRMEIAQQPEPEGKVIWRFWDAGFERSHHGAPGIVDLGDISESEANVK